MNPIAKTLDQHKKANQEITATTGKMAEIYRLARERLNAKLQAHVLSGKNPLEGAQLVKLIEDLTAAYSELEEAFRAEFGRAIPYVAESYYFDALKDLNKSILGKPDTAKIELLKQDAFTHVAGMTQNMLKTDVAFLRQNSAEVFRLASATGITREEATQSLLGRILTRPEGFQFVDAGGRVWNNEAYCKMLSRTVLLNAGRQTYFDTCAENGNDVVRVTVSGNPCPACAVWENRLLSISGATEGLPTVSQATAAGLCHPNCTHSFVAVGEFVQQEDFTADGRPKEGVNSPGKEEKDDKEAWQKYRNSLKPQKAKKGPSAASKKKSAPTTPATAKPAAKAPDKPAKGTPAAVQPELPLSGPKKTVNPADQPEPATATKQETRKKHRARRQEQWEAAYDKRRDAWYQQIIKDGGSKELAGELADAYTPEVAKSGKPPRVVFGTASSQTGLSKDGTELVIRAGADTAEIKKALGNFAHRLKRGTQYRIARENRYSREAKMIGAKRIKGEHTREQDLKAVNPNFVPGRNGEWENNCQRCVTAYEARRRGIDVTAKQWTSDKEPIMWSDGWSLAYKNGKIIDCSDTTGLKARTNIIREMNKMPDGARCAVQVIWKGRRGGGHVFIAEKQDGKIAFIDPQPHGETIQFDCDDCFKIANGRLVHIMRLDNLKFSNIVKECCRGI